MNLNCYNDNGERRFVFDCENNIVNSDVLQKYRYGLINDDECFMTLFTSEVRALIISDAEHITISRNLFIDRLERNVSNPHKRVN